MTLNFLIVNKRKSTKNSNQKLQAANKEVDKSEDIPVEVAQVIKDLPKEKQQKLI